MTKQIGLHKLFSNDKSRADEITWGRRVNPMTRRGFIRGSGLAAMSGMLGASIPFAEYMPGGLIPALFAQSDEPFRLQGKEGLRILNDRPINAETPAHLLDDKITPASRLFVRNNGIPPELSNIDVNKWTLDINGESVVEAKTLSLQALKRNFEHHTLQLQIECGGNGRAEFSPPARGNQWSTGAIGCPEWTGVRLRDVLEYCGIKEDAVYIAYEGADLHLSGDPSKRAISRGVPLNKALEDESMLVWAMNGEALPLLHGYPLRMICAGWPASVNGKWLNRIMIRNRLHDGAKMLGQSYRVPCKPIAPGTAVTDKDMCIIESMPVKSLITFPKSGLELKMGSPLYIRGHAWAGDLAVNRVLTSIDFGASWQDTSLKKPVNRLAWQHWSASVNFPEPGYYEVWARATDENGTSQPMILPAWNPRGYLNNACHRIAIQVRT